MNRLALLALLLLAGCSGTHAPCSDASAGPDAGPAPAFNARLACGLTGRWYDQQAAAGVLDCPRLACPFAFDPIDPTSGQCDPEAVEWCLAELEGRGNDCDQYAAVIAECAALDACR